ncbi:MAG: hypothetical protein K6C95_08255, partial [Lachnospiraceae bacterium]|nr:hypothetical protein [Lachnospiraceae bacterium]
MKRFLALAMSLVIGATSVWTTGLETRAAESGDTDEQALIENGEEEDVYDNIFGDDPINKKDYYATFTVETNGEQIVKKYKISGAARVPKDNWVLEPVSSFNADEDYDDYEYDDETDQYIYYKKVNHPQLVSGNQTLAGYAFYSELKKDLDTFLAKDKGAEIVGWTVYTDGHNSPEDDARTTQSKYSDSITYLNSDACTYGNSDGYWDDVLGEWVAKAKEFQLNESRDYHFVAQVAKKAAEDIYVSLIPGVYFDGREHIAQGTELKRKDVKNKATDLRVGVFRKTYGGYDRLYAGTDYTIEYKNNVNASVKLVRDGENAGVFEKAWTDNNSRPTVHVEGINDYKGFSADMYFDILPVTLGASESRYDFVSMDMMDYYNNDYNDDGRRAYGHNRSDAAGVSGLAYTYTPSTVTKIKKITVTKSFSNSGYFYNAKKKTIETYTESYSKTLNADADYKLEVYKWNADTKVWTLTGKAPKECTEEGDYLCVVRGIGNYCGAVYGYSRETTSADDNMFNAGGNGKDPNPFQSNATYMQFKVTKNAAFDLTKAKVKIGAKKKKYVSDDKKYGASDFKITVKAGKKKIKLGEDYTVSFSPAGGSHMKNENGVNYGSTIAAANLYNVYVYGIGNYYGSKYAGTVKITGLTLKANMFTYLKKVGHDQEQKVELSDKGKNKKLTFTDKTSPYFVPDVAANESPRFVKSGKKGTTYCYYMGDDYYEAGYTDAAGKYVSGSYCRIGNGIYPKTVKLQYLLKYEKISIEQAINEKRLGIKLGEKPAEFNYGGAYPDVTLTTYYDKAREEEFYNEETGMMEKRMVDHYDSQYDGEREVYRDRTFEVTVKGYHYIGMLTVTGQNNTAVGSGATLTFAGSGILTGTKTESFTVAERNVEYLE